ncbi:unnamed protein product [Ectocarpus sp. 6 AP-2014]
MQQEREWERKKMARQQELEQLKLRQQEQERERKKKVEQEREAHFGRLWQREQEREQEWEQEREQERDRRAQKKMQQERQQKADDHAKSHEGLQHRQQTSQQQQQQQQQRGSSSSNRRRQQQQQQQQRQGLARLGDSHAVRNASETPPRAQAVTPALLRTPTEPRRGTSSVLTTTVKRALRMAGTEAEARRITLSAVLRHDRDVPGSSTGLPQQQIRERVEHTLDFLCSPEASGLGRKRRMGTGRKVSKTIFWAHVGAIARQRRLAKADALPGSTEKRQGCNTGGVLPAPRDSSPRGQEQREALGLHERQQRGIPQTTIEARPLPGLTRDLRTIQVEHPPKSSSVGFSLGREATRQEVESSFVKSTSGGKTVNALPFLPIPPVGPLAGRRGGAFGALTNVEARPLPGLTRGDPLKVAHPPKGSSGGFSVGREATRQEVQSFLKTNSGGKTVDALPFLRIPPEKPATPTVAIPAASVTSVAAAVSVPTGTEENPIHGTDSAPVTAAAAAAAVPVPTGTEENPIHGTVSAYVTAAAAAAVSVTTGAEEDPTHGMDSAPVAAAASAVPVATTRIEAVLHDGAGFSSTNKTSVACTVMSIPDLPEYEEQRAAQEAQIRRNRPATKTDPPAPNTTVGNARSTSTAASVTPKTEQPFERVKQGKWRVLTADYLSTDSEDGSGEEDGWG